MGCFILFVLFCKTVLHCTQWFAWGGPVDNPSSETLWKASNFDIGSTVTARGCLAQKVYRNWKQADLNLQVALGNHGVCLSLNFFVLKLGLLRAEKLELKCCESDFQKNRMFLISHNWPHSVVELPHSPTKGEEEKLVNRSVLVSSGLKHFLSD